MQGGLGPCGKTLCCSSWITDFGIISIKMAKEQGLPLNPSKISGVCGRLLCCLSYENENYIQAKQSMPQLGAILNTPSGPGKVVAVNVPQDSVEVMLESGVTIQIPVNLSQTAVKDSRGSCGSCGLKGGGCSSKGSNGSNTGGSCGIKEADGTCSTCGSKEGCQGNCQSGGGSTGDGCSSCGVKRARNSSAMS